MAWAYHGHMETTKAPAQVQDSLLSTVNDLEDRVQAKMDSACEVAHFMGIVKLTPDGLRTSEWGLIFPTARGAKIADHMIGVQLFAAILALFPSALIGGFAGEATHWTAGILTFALSMAAFFFGFDHLREHFSPTAYSASNRMVVAWTRARLVLEEANEENTVPAILEKLQELDAELKTIYTTYGDIISPVEREQAEADFLTAAGLVEVLAEEATVGRFELYSTRRSQLLGR